MAGLWFTESTPRARNSLSPHCQDPIMITVLTTEKPNWCGKWEWALERAPGAPCGERKLVLSPDFRTTMVRVDCYAESFHPISSQQSLK